MALMPYRYGGGDEDRYRQQQQALARSYGVADRFRDAPGLGTLSAQPEPAPAPAAPAPAADGGGWLGAMGGGGMSSAMGGLAARAEAAPKADWLGAVGGAQRSINRGAWGAPANIGRTLGQSAIGAAMDRGAENQMAQQRQAISTGAPMGGSRLEPIRSDPNAGPTRFGAQEMMSRGGDMERAAQDRMSQGRSMAAQQQPPQQAQQRSRFQYGQAPPLMRRPRPMPRFGPARPATQPADANQAQVLKPKPAAI